MKLTRVTVAALLVLAPAAAAVPAHASGPAFDAGRPVQLMWDRVPGLAQLTALGPAPSTQVMHVQVAFRSPHIGAELANLRAMYTPGSAQFHRFLTPKDIGDRYGADPGAVADVVHRLTAAGLRVDFTAATGDVVSAHGPVAAVERAFHVTEQRYRYNNIDFIANTTGPTVMSGDEVGTVVGLDTLARFQLPKRALNRTGKSVKTAGDPGDGFAFDDSAPDDLWAVYGMPAGIPTGAGQRLAIIGDGDTKVAIDDLRKWENYWNTTPGSNVTLPQVPVITHCPEPDATGKFSCGPDDSAGDGEWDIDFQASTGMAPGMDTLEPYFGQSILDSDINYAFLGWINDADAPKQASASLGECEQTPLNGVWTGPLEPIDGNNSPSAPPVSNAMGNDEQALLDTALMHAAEQGKTLFASTGDSGAYCDAVYPPTNTNGVTYGGDPDVEYPATSAFAVAVGGTVLFTDDGAPAPVSSGSGIHRVDEHAWEYGGGGPSHFEPAWFYQTANNHAFSNAVVPCLSSPDGSPTGTGLQCRALPDVAAQSGDVFTLNGYDIWTGGGMCDGCGGGTSLSSPLWAGMWTRIQSSNPDSNGYGYANALLYALGEDATAGPRDFTDVTVGNNGGYTATPGWDYVSGFGTPNVANIISDAAKVAPFTSGANLPEAPVTVLLPAVGVAILAGAGFIRRRRRRV